MILVFPHQDWGDDAAYYTSDYHPVNKKAADSWSLEVHSDQAAMDVRLYWCRPRFQEGLYSLDGSQCIWRNYRSDDRQKLIQRILLKDIDNGIIAQVVIDGWEVRRFRWVLAEEKRAKNGKSKKET